VLYCKDVWRELSKNCLVFNGMVEWGFGASWILKLCRWVCLRSEIFVGGRM